MNIPNIRGHHHYKGDNLSRSEKIEKRVVSLLLSSKLPDSERDSSIVWELKHSSGCCQIARILAEKRGLNLEIAETAAVLHDIYVIIQGKYQNHAKLGAPIAEEILNSIGGFSHEEIGIITEAVAHHSEKDIYTQKPFVELIKDADVFDCSLYKGAEGDYKINKTESVFKEYVRRIELVRKELGLSGNEVFRS